MADLNVKFATGEKGKIEEAKTAGKLDANDFVVTSDTDELAFINKDGETKFLKSKSTKEYTLKGTDLGALKAGQTIPKEIDMDGLLNLITQKSIPATYTKPSVTLTNNAGSAAGNVEAGTSITPKLRATFNKNDAGDLTAISIKKGAQNVKEGTASPLDYAGETIIVGDETVTFTASATYKEGAIKNDNLGNPSPNGHILAGTVASSGYSITGKRNLFYGTGVGNLPELNSATVRGLANKQLNPSNGLSFNINIAQGQQFIIFAYPATLRDVNQVMYVETNDTGMASSFTKTLVDVADARGGENGKTSYKVYSYRMSTPAAAGMTFKVTI